MDAFLLQGATDLRRHRHSGGRFAVQAGRLRAYRQVGAVDRPDDAVGQQPQQSLRRPCRIVEQRAGLRPGHQRAVTGVPAVDEELGHRPQPGCLGGAQQR